MIVLSSAAAFASAPDAPQPAQMDVGGRPITMPPPQGFVRCDGIHSEWDKVMASMLPATNRMLATYGTPEDHAALQAGRAPGYDKNFNVQVMLKLENQEIGSRAFRQLRNEMKGELDKLSATIDEQLKKQIATGNKKISAEYGVDDAMQISNTVVLGNFEDSETSYGFTMAMKVQAGGQEESRLVVAALMTPVNGRLLTFYATGPFKGEADRQWAETSVAAWRDTVVAANPKVVGPALGFDWTKVGRSTVIGALIGGVIGLVGWLGRKATRRA
jgi:hypothetical protein